MPNITRILLVEDDRDDYVLTSELLYKIFGTGIEIVWETSWARSLDLLLDEQFEVCLLDYLLGERNGVELVTEAKRCGVGTPLILMSGKGSREIDLAAMEAGAADYLDKGCLSPTLLERSIRYAVRHCRSAQKVDRRQAIRSPRILLIEDDEDDFILTQDLLQEVYGAEFKMDWVRTWQHALTGLSEQSHDIYLLDYRLGQSNGLDLVAEAQLRGFTAPIILLTGQGNRELDLEAMQAGAADYLVKGEITAPLLDRAIRYAIERCRGEQRLTELAQFDQLTGLANRSLFRDYLTRTVSRAARMEAPVAILFLDLDRFKIINDTYGHEVGDELLVCISDRLKHSVRTSDLVARLGGDEFTVVVDGISDPTILSHFAERILAALNEPIRTRGLELSVDASIGIAVYPDDADSPDELLRSADAAMYRAKENGAGSYQFYTITMQIVAYRQRQLEIGLRQALVKNEFEVWYQPQMDLTTGRICGIEALLRWMHPESGLVPPGDFIELAEETGLIVPIGEWVFKSACLKARELHELGQDSVRVAVNFSARQFQEKNLVNSIDDIISSSGIPPQMLEIELTESSILKDPKKAGEVLRGFASQGINLALDDFGTGYSSLKHLQTFPGATIKIDRSFVSNIVTNADDAAIVRAIISMAHNLRLKVIAEGVETNEQLQFLVDLNCDAIQGYLLSKPAPSQEITPEFLAKKAADVARFLGAATMPVEREATLQHAVA